MMALKLGNFFEPDFNEILPVANLKKCYKIIVSSNCLFKLIHNLFGNNSFTTTKMILIKLT